MGVGEWICRRAVGRNGYIGAVSFGTNLGIDYKFARPINGRNIMFGETAMIKGIHHISMKCGSKDELVRVKEFFTAVPDQSCVLCRAAG